MPTSDAIPAAILARAPPPAVAVPAPTPAADHASAAGLALPHHIVIVGGGAGGLILATKLGDRLGRRGKARITLVDCALTHVWKPLLHEIAAGTLRADADGIDYLVHARRHHFTFELGRMTGLDRGTREILLEPVSDASGAEIVPAQRIGYGTLVIAVGSMLNDFGVPGVSQHCLYLDGLAQAERIQQRTLSKFLRGHSEARTGGLRRLRVAIVGAGATGVEFAAELRHAGRQLVGYGLRGFDPDKSIEVRLIEAAPSVLPALAERLQLATTRQLEALDVEIHTSQQVGEVTAEGLHTRAGDLFPADLIVWTAGVKGPGWLGQLDGLEVNRLSQLVVDQTLKVTADEHIFALGDCAACPQAGCERPVPPRAQAAHQQAHTLARSLIRRIEGKPPRAVRLQGLWLADLAQLEHGRQSDGQPVQERHDRGPDRPPRLPVALQEAPDRLARPRLGDPFGPGQSAPAPHATAAQAALGVVR